MFFSLSPNLPIYLHPHMNIVRVEWQVTYIKKGKHCLKLNSPSMSEDKSINHSLFHTNQYRMFYQDTKFILYTVNIS